MESSSVITPEDVLESLMNDGTIDTMRLKIINQIKANEELKNTAIKMAEQSKVLNTPGAEKQTKRELFDALRQELEAQITLIEVASSCLPLPLRLRSTSINFTGSIRVRRFDSQDLLRSTSQVSTSIDFSSVIRRTSVLEKASKSVWDLILDSNGLGKEISETVERVFCRLSGREPPLFPLNVETQSEKEKENEKGKGKEIENGKENLVSPLKKRKFDEMSYEEGAYEGASGSSKPPAVPEDSSEVPQPSV
ncbi:hypothetical protein TEA_009897 [Camellia sinensis var. sinensis]|uniref:Uncharacterized protein n=1 Tax=Camellia sinensis var. sinensis TaxID=542762 RepID=A0A4S4CZC8_CAMSN|nr:hypothetical protein TEA_009897 [Camellia sinensis var. sinensis]